MTHASIARVVLQGFRERMRLTFEFFSRHTVEVAQDLLGRELIWRGVRGWITETEAYRGADDEASHAFRGPTPRSRIMFGPPGRTYVYQVYGIHFLINLVTEPSGQAGAVLLRGLRVEGGHCNGPGKLCKHLGITTQHNDLDVLQGPDLFLEEGQPVERQHVLATPRIGIGRATDKLWRFVVDSPQDRLHRVP